MFPSTLIYRGPEGRGCQQVHLALGTKGQPLCRHRIQGICVCVRQERLQRKGGREWGREGERKRGRDPFMNKIILPIWNNIILSVISRGTVNAILEPPNFPCYFREPLLGPLNSVFILPLKIQMHAFSVSAPVGHVQVAHWTSTIMSCSAAMGNLNQPQMKSTTFSSFRDDNYVSTITKIKK